MKTEKHNDNSHLKGKQKTELPDKVQEMIIKSKASKSKNKLMEKMSKEAFAPKMKGFVQDPRRGQQLNEMMESSAPLERQHQMYNQYLQGIGNTPMRSEQEMKSLEDQARAKGRSQTSHLMGVLGGLGGTAIGAHTEDPLMGGIIGGVGGYGAGRFLGHAFGGGSAARASRQESQLGNKRIQDAQSMLEGDPSLYYDQRSGAYALEKRKADQQRQENLRQREESAKRQAEDRAYERQKETEDRQYSREDVRDERKYQRKQDRAEMKDRGNQRQHDIMMEALRGRGGQAPSSEKTASLIVALTHSNLW